MSNKVAFTFESSGHPVGQKKSDPLADLIEAAGGGALPGKWGLVQTIAMTWTQPMSGPQWLRVVRCALLSVGAVKSWKDRQNPESGESRGDKWLAYARARKLEKADELRNIGGFAYAYLRQTQKFTDIVLTPSTTIVREFPCGLVAGFYDEADLRMCDAGKDAPAELHFLPGRQNEVLEAVRNAVWSAHNNNLDFGLQATDKYGESCYALQEMRRSHDYVDSPTSSSATTSLHQMADRCNKFIPAGISRRVLLYGPPGTGKSTMARKLSSLVGAGRTLRVDAETIEEAPHHAVERMLRLLRPTVLMLDDIDRAEGSKYFLALIENLNFVPLIVGSVNTLTKLDPALLRPGRFDEVITVELPDLSWREAILRFYMQKYEMGETSEVSARALAESTAGFAPVELKELVVVLSKVGADLTSFEIERIRKQKEYYSNDAFNRYNED